MQHRLQRRLRGKGPEPRINPGSDGDDPISRYGKRLQRLTAG